MVYNSDFQAIEAWFIDQNSQPLEIEDSIQETAEATGDLIDNKIADKITNASDKSFKELYSESQEANNEIPKER